MKKNIKVYYIWLEDGDDGEFKLVTVTEKSYFDKNRCISYGDSKHFEDISSALEEFSLEGAEFEMSEDACFLTSLTTEEELVNAMKLKGFDFIKNDDFDEYIYLHY